VAVASAAPSKVLERVDETLAAIAAARQRLEEERASVLGPQDRLFQEIAHCDDVLATIGQARTEWMGPLLSRDSLSIWRPEARTLTSINLGSRLGESVGDAIELTRPFLVGQLTRVPLQVALFVIVFVLTRLARARARRLGEKTSSEVAAAQVVELPLSSALVLTLLATRWIYPQAPRAVMNVVGCSSCFLPS
jgi:hypothetical protein